ncbi:MBL fold metallo-hydrolase [Thermoactinomyces mirandus]|uniref:MBL fold metallo-hydrolase n=1 Tax=Thermoactinomyces mirandus TaxID=2756294 RepID=A0A7W1XTC5_9BACL|nr:MBL fold metallo-hydrolase [Thermoactinomyces mirandus]MBA4602762.1 MBL fold metallo-hydrolase [Thermoactinomyces mirandus]
MKQWKDIITVPLPLPFALKIINAYLIKGETGYTIIDTGLHCEADLTVWEQAQEEFEWSWQDVEKIVLTHYHPDHYGLAGLLQEKTGAPVFMSRTDYEQAQMFFARESDMPETMANYFSRHGLPAEWAVQIPEHLRSFHNWVEPHPTPAFLEGGQKIRFGNYEYDIYHTPGHADGHLCFHEPKRKILISGDFLLPKITPNISLWPNCNQNPLSVYLETLNKMKNMTVECVFPSHGPMFTCYQERIEQLFKHHHERLGKIKNFIQEKRRVTAYDVCMELFGKGLTIHNLRFAMSETMAHLEFLRQNEEAGCQFANGQYWYELI